MAFQINEKMMASDRAIITRNKNENDLLITDSIKHKPGMMHYISDNQKMWLSVEPKRLEDNSIRSFMEIITDVRLAEVLKNYVHRQGGKDNSIWGTLHSDITTAAPFKVASTIKVNNLNVDMVDDMHVDTTATANTIVGRDGSGNAALNNKLSFTTNKISDSGNGIAIQKNDGSAYTNLTINEINSKAGRIVLDNSAAASIKAVRNTTSSNAGVIEWKDNVWKLGAENATYEVVTKKLYGHNNGINADMVDSCHVNDSKTDTSHLWTSSKIDRAKAPRGYGLGTDVDAITNNDCNAVTGTGFFFGQSPANGPENGAALLQSHICGKGQNQTIKYLDTKNKYSRIKNGSTWSSWTKEITKDNILEEGINIILSAQQPTGVSNNNTYWLQIL